MEHCEREGAQKRVCGRTGAPVHGQGACVLEGEGDGLTQSLHIQFTVFHLANMYFLLVLTLI